MIPIPWHITIDTLLNIISMRGKVESELYENMLLGEAVDIIENAFSYKGFPIANYHSVEPLTESEKNSVVVCFSLIFPSAEDLNKFMENFD